MARPKKVIDWNDVEKLCALQCTQEEIAQFCECSVDTLERHCRDVHGVSFAEYFKQKKGQGRISLRRAQWQAAQKGNPALLIWLGKQHLDQSDRSKLEHSGPDGRPIESRNLSDLTDAEVDARLKEYAAKALPKPEGDQ